MPLKRCSIQVFPKQAEAVLRFTALGPLSTKISDVVVFPVCSAHTDKMEVLQN